MAHSCKDWFRLIISGIGVFLGVSAFIAFFCVYGNHAAGVWALFSGIFAAVCLHLHYLHFQDRLDSWHSIETLQGVKLLGVMAALAGGAGFVWYIFVALYYNIPVMPVGPSDFITSVWAFMTFKWGVMMILFSQMYSSIIFRDNPRLLSV
ncbi:heme transporter hrg1-A [Anabrus simplex]|uniref:heme transporter hrg1-A n=1 Tax=Anabrus simplex TaxID=316456 RepID=UPI0034DD4CB7